MNQSLVRVLLGCWCLGLSLGANCEAENWPRFRGKQGAGISSETGIPATWTAADYAWVAELPGKGHSSPVIWDDQLFVTTGNEDGVLRRLVCLDVNTGKVNWQREVTLDTVHLHLKNSFASGTPVTNGSHVVACFADEKKSLVCCWDAQGTELWQQDIGEFISQHGPSCAPIIHGKTVVVAKDMMGPSAVYAFDLETGKPLWTTEREYRRTSYATPIVRTRADGIEEVICVSGMTGITGLELSTGKVLWKSPAFPMRTVGSPVLAGNLVVATCGSGGSGKQLLAVPLDQLGEVEPQFTLTQKLPYVPTPIYKDGFLYLLLDVGILACVNATTGEEVWLERIGGKFSGSPIWIEGRLYAIDEEGTVGVFAAGPEFKEYARIPLGDLSYSTPAVANGRLFLKTQSKVYCLPAK